MSIGLSVKIYKHSAQFPNSEIYGLRNQIRRSAVSIPSNIAEGSSRKSNKEFYRYLEIAIGSAYELETQLIIANEVGYISQDVFDMLIQKLTSSIKLISKFKSRIKVSQI